jgi:CBS-domain-containing membrane protein
MLPDYGPRETVTLSANLPLEHPDELPEIVHMNDPAMLVLTDFSRVHPVTIRADRSIEYALCKMRSLNVRLLIVVDQNQHMLGLISAYQILGSDPVRLERSNKLDHKQVTVKMLMQPANQICALDIHHLRDARVGHIVATLHDLEQIYLLVVDNGVIRGLFSASQISKQLGRDIMDLEEPAHSLAELIHEIG